MHKEPPSQQPGAEVLNKIVHITVRWIRGDIYSDEAIMTIGDIVGHDEFFEGCLESCGWRKES